MEAGTFLLHSATSWRPKCPFSPPPSRHLPNFRRPVKVSSNSQFKGPKPRKDWIADWVAENDDAVRSLPINVGGASLLAVLFNRAVSGIAPVADASR
uniref:Uncharacterized protein n=1 Tax=Rhizophora mucronata TaxID=61149 RepID=A0A2P2KXX7_RHIMU